jgi:hypothetical protein
MEKSYRLSSNLATVTPRSTTPRVTNVETSEPAPAFFNLETVRLEKNFSLVVEMTTWVLLLTYVPCYG